jgi:hypothetical protein
MQYCAVAIAEAHFVEDDIPVRQRNAAAGVALHEAIQHARDCG